MSIPPYLVLSDSDLKAIHRVSELKLKYLKESRNAWKLILPKLEQIRITHGVDRAISAAISLDNYDSPSKTSYIRLLSIMKDRGVYDPNFG